MRGVCGSRLRSPQWQRANEGRRTSLSSGGGAGGSQLQAASGYSGLAARVDEDEVAVPESETSQGRILGLREGDGARLRRVVAELHLVDHVRAEEGLKVEARRSGASAREHAPRESPCGPACRRRRCCRDTPARRTNCESRNRWSTAANRVLPGSPRCFVAIDGSGSPLASSPEGIHQGAARQPGSAPTLPAPRSDGLAGQNSTARLFARDRLGGSQAGRLAQPFEAREEERAVLPERPSNRPAELIELGSGCFLSSYLLAESSASSRS